MITGVFTKSLIYLIKTLKMKISHATLVLALFGFGFLSCKKSTSHQPDRLHEEKISLETHSLMSYRASGNSNTVLLFESGLGDAASVWKEKNILESLGGITDIIIYDRSGYHQSTLGPIPRGINKLSQDLGEILKGLPASKKIVLVGHSLGGMIIRDWAIKNADRVKGLLFIDPSHEDYNNPTQEQEDLIYDAFKSAYGESSGAAQEAKELRENTAYLKTLGNLPDVPTIVLTSTKITDQTPEEDRIVWYTAHEQLKTGVSNFSHLQVPDAGHYIQREKPDLIIAQIKLLIR